MKPKLLIFVLIISVMLPLAMPVLAAANAVKISRPEGNEIVTQETFSICGTSTNDEAIIDLFYYDKDTKKYEPLSTTEGESTFTVGKIFAKDIQLTKGENKIKIEAYTESTKDEKHQIANYTITLAEEKKEDNWLEDALNWFTEPDATEKK